MARAKAGIHVFDSFKGIELPEHRVFAVTYEPMWQGVRAGMSFLDVDEARNAMALMEAYLGRATTDEEIRCRVYRVLNLLNALPVGQTNANGLSIIPWGVEQIMLPYRKQVGDRARAVGKPTEWDWHTSRKQLQVIAKQHPEEFYLAQQRLRKRALRRDPKTELRYYLSLFSEVQIAET